MKCQPGPYKQLSLAREIKKRGNQRGIDDNTIFGSLHHS